MMMMIEKGANKGYQAKQEGDSINIEKFSMAASTSNSRQWTAFRNPRIVRVSRSLGGKDRHSKVCTIRGLRDRRIRLSVPTAIQLYDLQDRLGLNQPSKVIDWLIEATKSDIDKLPPLQIPHGFPQFHQQNLLPFHESSASSQFSLGGFNDAANIPTFLKDAGNQNLWPKSRYWDIDSESSGLKGKEADQKGKLIKTGEEENDEDGYNRQDPAQKLFPMGINNNSSLPACLLNNASMTYNNSSYHSEPSSLSLSQFGSHGLFPSHVDPHLPSGSQLLMCPSSATPSLFTPYAPFMANNSVELCDPRQFNHIQILSSSNSQQLMPHHPLIPSLRSVNSPLGRLSTPFISSKLLDSDNNNRSQSNKGTRS